MPAAGVRMSSSRIVVSGSLRWLLVPVGLRTGARGRGPGAAGSGGCPLPVVVLLLAALLVGLLSGRSAGRSAGCWPCWSPAGSCWSLLALLVLLALLAAALLAVLGLRACRPAGGPARSCRSCRGPGRSWSPVLLGLGGPGAVLRPDGPSPGRSRSALVGRSRSTAVGSACRDAAPAPRPLDRRCDPDWPFAPTWAALMASTSWAFFIEPAPRMPRPPAIDFRSARSIELSPPDFFLGADARAG